MQIALFRKFSLLEDIAYVPGYDADVALKKPAHLSLCQPDGFIGKEYVDLDNAISRLIYNYFVFHT